MAKKYFDKRNVRTIIVWALFMAVAGLAFYIGVIFPAAQRKALQILHDRLDSSLSGIVSVGSIATNLFSSIELHDIRIADTMLGSDSVHIDHLRAGYVLPLLLLKRVVFTTMIVDGVTASVTMDENGTIPLLQSLRHKLSPLIVIPTGKQKSRVGWAIVAGRITINRINGSFEDNHLEQHAIVHDGTLHIRSKKKQVYAAVVRVKGALYTSRWWTGKIHTLNTDIVLSNQGVKIRNINLKAEKSRIEGKGSIPFCVQGPWDLRLAVAAAIEEIPILNELLPDLSRKGNAVANVVWTGTVANPLMKLHLRGYDLVMKGVAIDSVSIRGSYDIEKEFDGKINVRSSTGDVDGSLECRIPALLYAPHLERYRAEFTYHNFNGDKFGQESLPIFLKGMVYSGHCSIHGAGVGGLPDGIIIKGFTAGAPIGNDTLRYDATLDATHWKLNGYLNNSSIVANGQIHGNDHCEGNFQATIRLPTDFCHLINGYPIDGDLSVDGEISGPIVAPSLQARVYSGGLSWNGITVDSLNAGVAYNPERQRLNSLYLSLHYDLGKLPKNRYVNCRGKLNALVTGYGDLFRPDIHATANSKKIICNSVIVDSLRVNVSLHNLDTLRVDNGIVHLEGVTTCQAIDGMFSLKKNWGTLVADMYDAHATATQDSAGKLCLQGGMRHDSLLVTLDTRNLSLFPLAHFLPLQQTGGWLDCAAVISGKPDNPQVHATMRIKEPVYSIFGALQNEATMSLKDSTMEVHATALIGQTSDSLSLHATIPFLPSSGWRIDTTGRNPIGVSVDAQHIPVAQILHGIDTSWKIGGIANVHGGISLTDSTIIATGALDIKDGSVVSQKRGISVTGVGAYGLLSGTALRPHLSYRIEGGPITMSGGAMHHVTAVGTVTEKLIDIYSIKIALPDSGLVHLDGTIPWDRSGSKNPYSGLSVNFSAVYLPLNILASFLPVYPLQDGTVQGKGTIRYVNGRPMVFGNLRLHNGTVITENINPSIGPVNASLEMAGDSVYLQKINALWGNGVIDVHGVVVFRGDTLPAIAVEAKADNLEWTTPDILFGAVEHADLQCTTVADSLFITGNIQSGATRYVQNISLTEIMARLQSDTVNGVTVASNGFAEKIHLNLGFDLQEKAVVDIGPGHLTLDGKGMLTGSIAQPSYVGELTTVDGRILYLDRQFVINHASLVNHDARVLQPVIDLEAQADILSSTGEQMDNYSIILTLKGDLKNPEFSLKDNTSTLNELEIISILTLGQPPGEMSGDLKDRLRAILSQSLLGFGSRKLEQFLGIEKFDLQGDFFKGNEGIDNARLTIVKRVTPRLMVLYETDVGNLNRPKISALFRIGSRFFLSGERNADGESGVDVIFKYSK